MVLVELKNIYKSYSKVEILNDISLEIKEGEVLGIIGPNGVGKSTLLSIILGLVKTSKGKVLYKNQKNFKENLGYVPQRNALYENLTAWENFSFYFDILNIKKSKKTRINEVAKYLNIDKDLNKKVSKFSGGMKRKLDIGVALLKDPGILIMDEPTAGLDIITRNNILGLIKKLNEEGKTIIFTSHYIKEMEELLDSIIFLKEKKIIYNGNKDKLLKEYNQFDTLEEIYINFYKDGSTV